MRILQINSVCGFGSTGRTVEELARFLDENGHDSFVAYGQGTTTYPKSYKYGPAIEKKYHALQTRLYGQQGLGSKVGTKQLILYIKSINPDVIHLRNLHGNHIHFPMLFKFLSESHLPVVWTLHDCWAFTGVCFHYTKIQCYKWKTQCNAVCPQHHPWLPDTAKDRVKEMFELKRQHFTSIKKMQIITVSKWLESEAKQSFLSKHPIRHIYNWVDNQKFHPAVEDIKGKYNIPVRKKIVLGVAAQWYKNSSKYNDAIQLFQMLPEDTCLVMVGSLSRGTAFPSEIIQIPYVNGTDELAKIYSAAMVYVHFSVEDTFGKVIAEAMACGTPAVVFNSTAISELVAEGCGYVAEPHNIEEVAQYINVIKSKGKAFYSDNCLKRVANHFYGYTNMEQYYQLYKKILN